MRSITERPEVRVYVAFDTPNTFSKWVMAFLTGFPYTHVRLAIELASETHVVELCHEGLIHDVYPLRFYDIPYLEPNRNQHVFEGWISSTTFTLILLKLSFLKELDLAWNDLYSIHFFTKGNKKPATCCSVVSWLLSGELIYLPKQFYEDLTK